MPEAEQMAAQGSGVFSTAPNMNALPTFTASAARTNTSPVKTNPDPFVVTPVQPKAPKNDPVVPAKTSELEPVPFKETNTGVSDELKAASDIPMQIDPGVVFKVQIGAFKEEVPLEIANKFLKIARKGIKNYKDTNGLTIYTVGTYKTYEEANAVKMEVISEGDIKDAFMIAYNDGVKISIEEAKTLTTK